MIEDDELREIYDISSKEHLKALEVGLLELEKKPDNQSLIDQLFRDAHSLKGDSRITGVEGVEMISHRMEEILGNVKKEKISLTSSICDRLYQMVDAMEKLVHEAVTDEPSGVDYQKIVHQLADITPNADAVPSQTPITPVEEVENESNFSLTSPMIEDEELREIYQISSEEHLEKLKTGCQQLDQDSPSENLLEELILEAQSLEIDSRMVGREDLETLLGKLAEILQQVQTNKISWNEVSDRCQQGLNGIIHLVKEAITGEPSPINAVIVLGQLTIEKKSTPPPETKPPAPPEATIVSTPHKIAQSYHIDTLRVPTAHLDALITQTGELTVANLGIAHLVDSINHLGDLWEQWKVKQGRQTSYLTPESQAIETTLNQIKITASDHSARLDFIATELDDKIRTLRLLPLSTIFILFPRMVRDISQQQEKLINFSIDGGNTNVDKQILEEIKDPLMHLIRNAIDHGIESPEERETLGKTAMANLVLRGYKEGSNLVIEVADDGRGLNAELIKKTALKRKIRSPQELAAMSLSQIYNLIFAPGFSTRTFITEISGRGVGLDVVRANVERLKGTIKVDSTPGLGCCFSLHLGTTLSTAMVMLLEVAGIIHALPQEYIYTCVLISPDEIFTLEGCPTIKLEEEIIWVVKLATILQLVDGNNITPSKKNYTQVLDKIPCVVIEVGQQKLGLLVDNLLDLIEVVIKPPSQLLERVPHILGATILGNGEVCMILNPSDLIESARKSSMARGISQVSEEEPSHQLVILLVEDSIAVRTQEKRILEKAGYEVVTAVDGLDGLQKLQSQTFDAIISDVEMPHLNGFSLTLKVRENPEYSELPIILVTSLASEEDKRKGAEAGANAYIVKDQFNQEVLLETLERLV
ncbi:MAG TPA: hybrid sensor histidine kinase/response regulator [Cyanothece sp. UBA12306]|nr:hybrid sensor histidine kinase/response regulator [Cyanothece sp. UBA12306]